MMTRLTCQRCFEALNVKETQLEKHLQWYCPVKILGVQLIEDSGRDAVEAVG